MKEINVTLSEEDFKKMLKKIVVHPNSKLIVDAIIGNLMMTSHGCTHLYKAFMGIDIIPKFKIGDNVWIDEVGIPTWRMNVDKMKADGKFFQGKLAGKIAEVDIYRSDIYSVEFEIYNTAGVESVDIYQMRESYLTERDDDDIELM